MVDGRYRQPSDTIAAVATPPGRGGIGVARISGSAARAILGSLCNLPVPQARCAQLATFRAADGTTIDRGLVLFFPAPHSFTGEDVAELHAHGSPVVLDRLVRRACALGARPARAGEFSERAFTNGKLDLAQAEAVADLIAARSAAQADAAVRSLDGEFSRRVQVLATALMRLRVEVEAAIDFSDDASEGVAPVTLTRLCDETQAQCDALLVATRQGARLADGINGVIVGAPNVGKSSLLNALARRDRAMVTDVPGTTRDVLREAVMLDGVELTLADTAGLRDSVDVVEGEGIRRARLELMRADLVLVVVEYPGNAVDPGWVADLPAKTPRIVIVNKIDLAGAPPCRDEENGVVRIALSARTGVGLDLLRSTLRRAALGAEGGGVFSARTRHVLALERTRAALASARTALGAATPELVAEDLTVAQRALGEITGEVTSEDLLGAIFSTFCIGK